MGPGGTKDVESRAQIHILELGLHYYVSPGSPGNSKVDFWAEMVAPRVDSGPQLRRPGGPKSQFLAKSRHKIEKKSIQEGVQEKHEKLIGKSLTNYPKVTKMEAKMEPNRSKSIKKRAVKKR